VTKLLPRLAVAVLRIRGLTMATSSRHPVRDYPAGRIVRLSCPV